MKKEIEVSEEVLSVIQNCITAGVNEGTKRAIERIELEKMAEQKVRYDNRLRNTKLLLKYYRTFKLHADKAKYTAKQLENELNDMLDKLECSEEATVVQSILKSKKRTEIMVAHIESMLSLYVANSTKSENDEERRRGGLIQALYLDEEKKSMTQIAENLHVSESTLKRDKRLATREIAVYVFGVDGIQFI